MSEPEAASTTATNSGRGQGVLQGGEAGRGMQLSGWHYGNQGNWAHRVPAALNGKKLLHVSRELCTVWAKLSMAHSAVRARSLAARVALLQSPRREEGNAEL